MSFFFCLTNILIVQYLILIFMFIYYHNRYGKENLELCSPKFLTKCRVCLGLCQITTLALTTMPVSASQP